MASSTGGNQIKEGPEADARQHCDNYVDVAFRETGVGPAKSDCGTLS